MRVELGGDEPREVGFLKVAHAHVDGDRNVEPLRPPLAHLVESRPQDVRREPVDQAGALCQGHELVRRDEATFRVAPAHERLHPHDVTVRESHLGLVVELEVAGLQRLTQRGDRAQPQR